MLHLPTSVKQYLQLNLLLNCRCLLLCCSIPVPVCISKPRPEQMSFSARKTLQNLAASVKKKWIKISSLTLYGSSILRQSNLNPCTHAKLLSRSIYFFLNGAFCSEQAVHRAHVKLDTCWCVIESVSTHGALNIFSYSDSPRKTRILGHFLEFGSTW